MSEINYNNLPEKVGELLEDMKSIKELLKKEKAKEPVPQKLTFDRALAFLSEHGYVMSKSKLYKLTALDLIPCIRFGNRLVFDSTELLEYCKSQTKVPKSDVGVMAVARSAKNQLVKTLKK